MLEREMADKIWLLRSHGHNSYLLCLEPDGEEHVARWIWIDPGHDDAFAEIAPRVGELMGGWESLAVVVSTGLFEGAVRSLPEVLRRAPQALFLMNADTWNFVSVGGIPEDRVRLAERFRPGLRFAEAGRGLQVVVNPYGQFTGSFLLFEPRAGLLFTGDLLAGEPGADEEGDAAEGDAAEGDWERIRRRQERLMPCNAAVRWTLGKVRALEGLRAICPQSGPLLRGAVMESFLDRLEVLPVGADLLGDASAMVSGPELVLEFPVLEFPVLEFP